MNDTIFRQQEGEMLDASAVRNLPEFFTLGTIQKNMGLFVAKMSAYLVSVFEAFMDQSKFD